MGEYHKTRESTPEATPENGKQPKETQDKSQKDRSRTVYKIRDAAGRHIADHIRDEKPDGKECRWRLPDGTWGLKGMKLSQLPLYGAEQVELWNPDELIVLCEGEKAGDALDRAGFNALGTVTGSSGTPGPEALEVLRNRLVCLWPDNDAPGRKHMERLAAALEGVAAEVLLYEWDEAPEGGDAADHPAVLKGSPGAVDRLLTDLLSAPRVKTSPRERGHVPETLTAAELVGMELPEVRWAVPGVLPEGVTLLGGKPKMGKSWLSLGLCIAVASGGRALGKIAVEQGEALYLALEDNNRRLKMRLKKMLSGRPAPERMHLRITWRRLDAGGVEDLDKWLEAHTGCRLVVIDTLKMVRPKTTGKRGVYDDDYEALEPLLPLAAKHGVAILVVHHLRKLEAGDPLDMISGSTGLTGGVDGALVLKRDRGKQDATLVVDGRDIEEPTELALKWVADIASWALMGDAEEFRVSEARQEILDVLRRAGVPLAPKEIAERIDKPDGNVRKLLHGMRDDGQVVQHGTHPRYRYTPTTTSNGNDGNDGNDGNASNVGNVTNVTGHSRGGNDKNGENSAYLSGSRRNVTVVTDEGAQGYAGPNDRLWRERQAKRDKGGAA